VRVVDASALLWALLGSPADAGSRQLLADDSDLNAPQHVDVEIWSALRRLVRAGRVTAERAVAALAVLDTIPLRRHPLPGLRSRVWALRHNLAPYDGAYVALAELLDAPLLTCDRRLAGAPGHAARIDLVEASTP